MSLSERHDRMVDGIMHCDEEKVFTIVDEIVAEKDTKIADLRAELLKVSKHSNEQAAEIKTYQRATLSLNEIIDKKTAEIERLNAELEAERIEPMSVEVREYMEANYTPNDEARQLLADQQRRVKEAIEELQWNFFGGRRFIRIIYNEVLAAVDKACKGE